MVPLSLGSLFGVSWRDMICHLPSVGEWLTKVFV